MDMSSKTLLQIAWVWFLRRPSSRRIFSTDEEVKNQNEIDTAMERLQQQSTQLKHKEKKTPSLLLLYSRFMNYLL